MDGSRGRRRFLLLLVAAGLVSLSGAQCFERARQSFAPPPPRLLPPSPTLEQVIEVVNRNNSQIVSGLTTGATLSGPGFPALRANLAFQRPGRFRLRAELLASQELDLGSNDELFWFWIKRNRPPAVYFCRHDQFAASRVRNMIPIDPSWLIDAMGIAEFDPALPHDGPYPLPNDRLEVRTLRNTPQGTVTKRTIIDAKQGYILEQHIYDAQNRLVASSLTSRHRRDALTGLTMPTVVEISSPANQFSLRLDLGKMEINRASSNSPELWTVPTYQGSPLVNLCQPSPQPTSATPTAVTVRPDPPPQQWRRKMY